MTDVQEPAVLATECSTSTSSLSASSTKVKKVQKKTVGIKLTEEKKAEGGGAEASSGALPGTLPGTLPDKTKVIKRTKTRHERYSMYLYKVLKQVKANLGISHSAMIILNTFLHDMFEKLALESSRLCKLARRQTLDTRTLQTATRLLIPDELGTFAVSSGTKAVTHYFESLEADKKKDVAEKSGESLVSTTRSKRAKLQFPVGRVARYLRRGHYAPRVSAAAPVFLAAVLEYLSAEMLEVAGKVTEEHKRSRITPRHVQLAVAADQDMHKLIGDTTIHSGGVIPRIHASLLPEKRIKVAKKAQKKPKVQKTSPKTPKTPKAKQPSPPKQDSQSAEKKKRVKSEKKSKHGEKKSKKTSLKQNPAKKAKV